MSNKEMAEIRRLVSDGIFATRELSEIGKRIGPTESELVKTSTVTEANDPSYYSTELLARARVMSEAYFAFYLFENKVRALVSEVLREAKGPGWFDEPGVVPDQVKLEAKRRIDEEGEARFHAHRGEGPLCYVGLPDLGRIIDTNWSEFSNILYRREWIQGKFEDLRLTRNAIAHMGDLSSSDLERVEIIIKDLNKQIA